MNDLFDRISRHIPDNEPEAAEIERLRYELTGLIMSAWEFLLVESRHRPEVTHPEVIEAGDDLQAKLEAFEKRPSL